jgi:AcrR family transcriptional regulator
MPRAKTADKETAILEAASRIFAAKDFHDVLTDEIAAAAGIGKGTIYRYFQTKDELYLATVVHSIQQLHAALLSRTREEASPARRLKGMARDVLSFSVSQQHLYALLSRQEGSLVQQQGKLKKDRERLVRLVQSTIVEGIEKGELRGVDPRIAAELFLGMLKAPRWHRRESDTAETLAREVADVFLNGVCKESCA